MDSEFGFDAGSVSSRIASDMGHHDAHALTGEKFVTMICNANVRTVNITVHCPQGFKCRYLIGSLDVTYVASMPNFVYIGKKCPQFLIKEGVGI